MEIQKTTSEVGNNFKIEPGFLKTTKCSSLEAIHLFIYFDILIDNQLKEIL